MIENTLIKVNVVEEKDNYGKFEISPLTSGYGQTIGNSLRRVLLSSLKGAAVIAVKINGAKHEYTTVNGVEEDVMKLLLNLKQLRVICFSDEEHIIYLNVKKAGEVKASDIEANSMVQILNPDLIIANLADSKSSLSVEITVKNGVGYQTAENKRNEIGLIPLDANFSPVERVNFSVGSARLGQITDLDKLTIEIYTKSITPSLALNESLSIFTEMLNEIKGQVIVEESVVVEEAKPKKKTSKK